MSDSSAVTVSALHVSHHFQGPEGEIPILNDVNLEVCAGEAVAILGPSGSGKSTLLGQLAGLDRPSAGEIRLLGERIDALDEDGRAAVRAGRVGFVFQSFQLLPALTALENVLLPLELAGMDRARERALDALERVGVGHRRGHYPGQLSGGEQQRVGIARGFAIRPRILFADEPTGSLDNRTGEQIAELLFGLRAEAGSSLVLVTHDPALADRCDRRYRLEEGSLWVS